MEVSKLVQSLRFCGDEESCCSHCPSGDRLTEFSATECMCDLMQKAANAIGELRLQLESHRDSENAIRLEEKQATIDGWIPVTERLPEENERVLVWIGNNRYNDVRKDTDRVHNGKWVRWGGCVTHWAPWNMPQPPKGE